MQAVQVEPDLRRSGYRRGAVIIALVTAAAAGLLLVFGIQAIQRIHTVENYWGVYSQDAAEADQLLHEISVEMGYGGYIHNFKNYLLRRDKTYVDRLAQNRAAADAQLLLLEFHVIGAEEQAALAAIRATMVKYDSAVDRARVAFARGLSSVEVDILVKVDNTPSLAAFAVLDQSFLKRSALARAETEKALGAASTMVWRLLVVVPIVVLLGVMLILFLRRIVDGNARQREVRDELETLLRQAPDAILHVAQDGSILRANDQALALFGYSRDVFLTLSVESLVPNQFRGAHPEIRDKAFTGMRPRPIGNGADLLAVTQDGREIPVEISLSFTVSGNKRIAAVIVRDVTARKRAEENLKNAHDALELRVKARTAELEKRTLQLEAEMAERQRAESQLVQSAKMATIGEMSSGITHELNQPMNIMRMGVEAAQIRIQRGQSDIGQLSETLKKVEDQIVRMSDIITHMRAFSRLDTEGQTIFDPVQGVAEGCKLFAAQLQGDNINLVVNLPTSASSIIGHPNRLEQVILNLLGNARDAIKAHREQTPHPNESRISVTLREDVEGENIIIIVEDSGGGVPHDVLPHIFAPFVTTKESGRGTGLGLSISFGIVQAMNGIIDVMNGPHGARFALQFPVASETEAAKTQPVATAIKNTVPPARVGSLAKIMVVDDEISAAHSLADFLQDIGYLVSTAYNGEEAQHLYDSDPADVVITDLRMPVMDGVTLAQKLRERSPDLPIFIMTGQGADDVRLATAEGVTEVWEKPLSLAQVAQRLQTIAGALDPQ